MTRSVPPQSGQVSMWMANTRFRRCSHDKGASGLSLSTLPFGSKIILIDGDKLAQLMIEFNVGVPTQGQFLIKQIDSDYLDQ